MVTSLKDEVDFKSSGQEAAATCCFPVVRGGEIALR
jgi:hypothetical protein